MADVLAMRLSALHLYTRRGFRKVRMLILKISGPDRRRRSRCSGVTARNRKPLHMGRDIVHKPTEHGALEDLSCRLVVLFLPD